MSSQVLGWFSCSDHRAGGRDLPDQERQDLLICLCTVTAALIRSLIKITVGRNMLKVRLFVHGNAERSQSCSRRVAGPGPAEEDRRGGTVCRELRA